MLIKRAKVSVSSLGFSNLMLLAIAAAVLLAVRFTVAFGDNRKLPSDYEQIDAVIESTRQDLSITRIWKSSRNSRTHGEKPPLRSHSTV